MKKFMSSPLYFPFAILSRIICQIIMSPPSSKRNQVARHQPRTSCYIYTTSATLINDS